MRSERGAHGGRRAADETRGGLGAAMDAPDGTPGSGWDVRFDTPEREALNLPPGPLDFGPGPSAGQKPTSEEVRPSTPRGKLEGGDRARASGEASGSGSGSPDENVNKRSNPPSPRERLPASPEAARARDESGVSTPSSPLPHQIPAAFEQRRRDALAAKQRRLDGIIGRVSSRQESGHGEEQRASSATSSLAVASSSPRMRSSPARSKKTDSDVDEDWDELLADATPLTRPTAHEPPVATPSWRAFEPTPEPRLKHDPVERDESSRRERETTTTTTATTTDSTFAFDGAMHATHARSNAPNAALRKGWLSDAAAAAERAAELAGEGPMPPPARFSPRAEVVEKDKSFAEEDTVYSAEASASSPGAFTPRKPPPSPFPSTPQSRDDGRRASPAMDKVAAARRIMAAASPARRVSSPGAAREPVTNLVFSPPPPPRSSSAASTPKPSRTLSPLAGAQRASAKNAAEALVESSPSGSGSAAPDARKRAAARRIIIAAAARKASAGVPVDAASLSASAIRNDIARPETPKPAPFESPISPILAHSDASPAEPAAGKPASKNQEHKKPLAARGLGSALEANADVRTTEPIPIDSVQGNDAETPTTQVAIESAAAIESTFSPGPEEVDVVEASAASESAAVPPEDDVEPRHDALALREESAAFPFRAPETSHAAEPETSPTSFASTKKIDVSGDAFAFDAPKPEKEKALPALLEEPAPASLSPEASPEVGDADRYDTDAGYGTALETQSGFLSSLGVDTAHDSSKRARGRTDRATRVALERAEMLAMRLEENEFLREALETRVAEAERVAEQALASKQSSVSDQLDRLREEVDRNAYLRRLLKKAEQRRGEARAREREAGAKFEALQSSAHRDAAAFASRLDRYEEESRGMRRRVSAEKARSQALERALSRANVELAEQHRRGKTKSQLLGMAVAAVVVLVLRVLAGGRNDAPADAGGYRGGRQAYVADAAARAANAARAAPPRAAGFGPAV